MKSLGRSLRARSVAAFMGVALIATACDVHTPIGPGDLTRLVVTPNATLAVNGTQQFVAVGTDAEGRVIDITPSWTVVSGGGAIDANSGLFTAGTTPGIYTNTIQATADGQTGNATVTVTVGAVTSITVTPTPVTVGLGGTQQYTAIARDAGNNAIAITPVWSVTAGGGSISAGGLFTAGVTPGTFTNTVRATSGTVFGTTSVTVSAIAPSAPLVPFGNAASRGILAGSSVSCVTLGIINADVSVHPGNASTGFPPCTITGQRNTADASALAAQNDLTTAYNQLTLLPCGTTLTTDLGGQTLQPGVFCSLSSQGLTGAVSFDALGDPNASFVVRAASTITTASAVVTLLNGAQAKNIYWVSGSSVTLGVGSAMKGNIVALTSITLIDNATLIGRALARNGAVTLNNNNVISLP